MFRKSVPQSKLKSLEVAKYHRKQLEVSQQRLDHFSEEDIDKVKKENTIFVAPKTLQNRLLQKGIDKTKIVIVEPNKKYLIEGIEVETIPAYNVNKPFHPKSNEWVGYIVKLDNIKYYIAGDTDITEENQKVKCDVAFVPVGGTYTMDYKQAAELINTIKPEVAVPIHYGSIVGTKQDAVNFVALLEEGTRGVILMR